MIDIAFTIHGNSFYKCSYCGHLLFNEETIGGEEWEFCPFCGTPLYASDRRTDEKL